MTRSRCSDVVYLYVHSRACGRWWINTQAGNDEACGRLKVAGTFSLFHIQQSKISDFILQSGGMISTDLKGLSRGFLISYLFSGEMMPDIGLWPGLRQAISRLRRKHQISWARRFGERRGVHKEQCGGSVSIFHFI